MGSPVTKWKAVDGAEFDTQKDMLLHELGLNEAAEIAVFLDTQYTSSRRKSEYKRVLAQFAEYMRDSRYVEPQQLVGIESIMPQGGPVPTLTAQVVEWVPDGGYMLQEGGVVDDSAEIERSFRRAQKL